jgi:hypothetical protein
MSDTEIALPADRAALITRLIEVVPHLTDPEVVELRSLLDAMARRHDSGRQARQR